MLLMYLKNTYLKIRPVNRTKLVLAGYARMYLATHRTHAFNDNQSKGGNLELVLACYLYMCVCFSCALHYSPTS